jgi:arylsulfatase A-like enzyme
VVGAVHAAAGRTAEAIASYRRAAALDDRAFAARNNLAELLAAQGDLDGALAAAQEAYAIASDDPQVLDTLGSLYLRRGLVERAKSLLEEARRMSPGLGDIPLELALPDREEGRTPEARRPPIPAATSELAEGLAALESPNLVLIVVDTLRADWTTAYGHDVATTPEIRRWADRGVLFERVRSQSSWTKIAMASLLTSLWPRTHAIRDPKDGLAPNALTLAEVLREAGYRTYAVQTNGWLDQSFGFHQGFDRYMFPRGRGARRLERPSIWPHADRVVEEASRLIDAHDSEQPFLLYLHFMDVHQYAAPPEFKDFGTGNRGAYLAAIRWVDDAVSRVRRKLADAGVLDRTVMVFTADHGEAFGENGQYGHARNVLTSVLWVPLVIRFPFRLTPIRVDVQVRTLDIAPTLLDIAGAPIPASFEGRSLFTLLSSGESESDRVSYAGLGEPLFRDAAVQVSLNDGSWSFARNVEPDSQIPEFLFDRRVDPRENVNLIDREPEKAAQMRTLLDHYLARKPRAEVLETDVHIDPSIADRLRALGYLR